MYLSWLWSDIREPGDRLSKRTENESSNQSQKCSIRLASGKEISPEFLAKLKSQIAENEKQKYLNVFVIISQKGEWKAGEEETTT